MVRFVPVFKTLITELVAPAGTVTVKVVAFADVTVAFVAPKNTMLLAGVVLKFVPLIVTASPGLACRGLKEVIVGGGGKTVIVTKPALPEYALLPPAMPATALIYKAEKPASVLLT